MPGLWYLNSSEIWKLFLHSTIPSSSFFCDVLVIQIPLYAWQIQQDLAIIINLYNFLSCKDGERRKEMQYISKDFVISVFFFILGFSLFPRVKLPSGTISCSNTTVFPPTSFPLSLSNRLICTCYKFWIIFWIKTVYSIVTWVVTVALGILLDQREIPKWSNFFLGRSHSGR